MGVLMRYSTVYPNNDFTWCCIGYIEDIHGISYIRDILRVIL